MDADQNKALLDLLISTLPHFEAACESGNAPMIVENDLRTDEGNTLQLSVADPCGAVKSLDAQIEKLQSGEMEAK